MEHPELDWNGRLAYLLARHEIRQTENYTMDLLWVLAKGCQIKADAPMPSEIWENRNKIDRRSGKEIVNDLLKKLGGE